MGRIVVDITDKKSGVAMLEINGITVEVPLESLPEGTKEGDIITLDGSKDTKVKDRIQKLEKRLFK